MIDSIKVENFKSLKNNTIRFNQLTVLAGSNSVGKSSIIQSILLSRIAIEKLTQFNLLSKRSSLKGKNINVSLNGKFALNLGNVEEVLTRNVNSDSIYFSLYDEKQKTNLKFEFNAIDLDAFELELLNKSMRGRFLNLRNEFYYLNAERLGPRLDYDLEQQDFPNVGCQGEFTIQILASKKSHPIKGGEKRLFKKKSDNKLLSQARLWMDFVIPGFELSNADLHKKMKKAEALFSGSSPTNVGFGISYVLPIIVNGLIAEENTVFIIENPEAHLHPSGQSRIGRFLGQIASSGVQVIIETHSEHVINGIRIAVLESIIPTDNIIINFFNSNKKTREVEIEEIQVKETGDLSKFPRDFFDQVQQDMAHLYRIKKNKNAGTLSIS